MAPDERRRRLASGSDLHVSERYGGAQLCSELNISVASFDIHAAANRQPVQLFMHLNGGDAIAA